MSSWCAHEVSEPVEIRDGGTTVVARICVNCLDELPAGWGCDDCQWVEEKRLCDARPTLTLGVPCVVHAGAP